MTRRATPTTTEDLVIEFLNTLDVEDGTDELESVRTWRAWAGTRQTSSSLANARRVRDHLRTLASGDVVTSEVQLPLEVRIGADGAILAGSSVLGDVAAAVATLSIENRLARVKICPADDCRWAFYDHSKNQSRQWCSMQVCGNRAKARNHRERAGG